MTEENPQTSAEENLEKNISNENPGDDEITTSQEFVEQQPSQETPPVMEGQSSHTGRKIAVSLMVILGLLLLFVANLGFWASSTLLNTNRWVNTVGPLTQDPEIAQVIGVFVASEISEATDINQAMTEMLPAEFQILSAPLSSALGGLMEDAVAAFVQSDVVNAVWVTTNRVAHSLVIGVLKGEGDIIYLETGQLVVDVSPLTDAIQDTFGLDEMDLDLVGEDGRIVLLENQQVAVLQQVVALLNAVGLWLPLISLVVLVIAVWVSLWRRKTMLWIGIGMIIAMSLSILVYKVAESWLLVGIVDPLLRLFTGEILDVVTRGLVTQTIVLMVLGVLFIIGAWVAGPSRTAVSIRTTVNGWTNRSA